MLLFMLVKHESSKLNFLCTYFCNSLNTRDRPKTDFTFSPENENGTKMKFHFRPETKTKTATYFRPKTKTKLGSSRNNMRQSNALLCEYANDAAQIQNYKNSRY